jgi:hypothetical protein
MDDTTSRKVEWQAPEYTHKERTADWFWTIGLTALIASAIALWIGSFVFAIFILIGGACLIMFTIREPQQFRFSLEQEGLKIEKELYPWKSIQGFTIKNKAGEPYARLIIQTSKYFLPVYTILLPQELKSTVHDVLVKVVPEVELEESRSMQFMEKLGF